MPQEQDSVVEAKQNLKSYFPIVTMHQRDMHIQRHYKWMQWMVDKAVREKSAWVNQERKWE